MKKQVLLGWVIGQGLAMLASQPLMAAEEMAVQANAGLPMVTVAATKTPALEGIYSGVDPRGQFTVTRAGLTNQSLLVSFLLQGSAENGNDYQFITNSILIPGGKTSATINVVPIDDWYWETNETVKMQLIPDPFKTLPYHIGTPSNAVMTIRDNDEPTTNSAVVTVTASDGSASENPVDTGVFRLVRTGNTNKALSVYCRFVGTASNGVDYTTLPGVVSVAAGKTVAEIVVRPIKDSLLEPVETVELILDNPEVSAQGYSPAIWPPSPPPYIIGSPYRATVRITDAPTNAPFEVALVQPTNGAVLFASNGVLLQARSYTAEGWVASTAFYSGSNFLGAVSNVFIPPMPHTNTHAMIWSNASVGRHVLRAVAANNRGLAATSAPVEITIKGQTNLPLVNVTAVDASATEGWISIGPDGSNGPARLDPGAFLFTRSGNTNDSLKVYFLLGGSALNQVDYAPIGNTVIIPKGAHSVQVAVTPIDDSLIEADETVVLSLTNNPAGLSYLIGPSNRAVVTLHDNDRATNLPPLVRIFSPTNGAQFIEPRSIQILADAHDADGKVEVVNFYAGTNWLGRGVPLDSPGFEGTNNLPSRSNDYLFMWTNPPAGQFELQAQAIDNLGAGTISTAVSITVLSRQAELTILSPTNGATFASPATIHIQAKAVDPKGYISRLEFYAGTNLIGVSEVVFFRAPDPGEPVYHSEVWDNPEPGLHLLTVRARDTLGQTVISDPVSILVQPNTNVFSVKRVLPASYRPGSKLNVRLQTQPPAGDHVFAIEDQPPLGWTVSGMSHDGIFDALNRKVKFGPFYNERGLPEWLSYEVTPSSQETGTQRFAGTASMDGHNYPIGGQQTINRLQLQTHPADLNPTNYVLAMNEMTAYVQAWQKGTRWPIEPHSIPANYVTKAIALWRNGEAYRYESSLEPPACWISLTNPIRSLSITATSTEEYPTRSYATRVMPERLLPGGSCRIVLVAAMSSQVQAYVVEEQVPSGWQVGVITEGGQWDPASATIKWAFYDGTARTLAYQITAPIDASGEFAFVGNVVAETGGGSQELTTRGVNKVQVIGGPWVDKILTISRLPSRVPQLSMRLVPGQAYELEVSTDLVEWFRLRVLTPSEAFCHFVDNAPAEMRPRFYRIKPKN